MWNECSNAFIVKLKTKQSPHFFTYPTGKNQRYDNMFCWWNNGEIGTFIYCWKTYTVVWPVWREIAMHNKTTLYLTSDSAIPSIGIYPENAPNTTEIQLHRVIYGSIITKYWKQPQYPHIEERLNKQWHSHTKKVLCALKNKDDIYELIGTHSMIYC